MSKQTSPLMMIAAFLMGIGLFSTFYPIFIKLFAPTRAWVSYQSYLLVGGLILLIISFVLFWINKSRSNRQ
jgi:hypothetical protein